MDVFVIVVCAAVVAGVGASFVAARWPAHQLAAPHGAVKRLARWLLRHPRVLQAVERHIDHRTAAGLAIGVMLVVSLAGLLVVGALLALLQTGSTLANIDDSLARWGAEHVSDSGAEALRFLTRFGATETVVVIALGVVVVERGRGRWTAVLGYLFAVIAGVTLMLNALKWAVHRDRPDIRPLANFASSSFPSGHAATAAAAFMAFALVLSRKRPPAVQALLAGIATAIATATAGSRVFLGVHWLSDVIAGVAMGWGWFAVCTIAFGGRLLRLGAPIEAAERAEHLAEGADAGTGSGVVALGTHRQGVAPDAVEVVQRSGDRTSSRH